MNKIILPKVKSDGAIEIPVEGNFFKLNSQIDFLPGTSLNLQDFNQSPHELTLANGAVEGEYLSAVFLTEGFNDLVLSWNADTPAGTWVELFARVYIEDYDGEIDSKGRLHNGWSDFISWGIWGPFIRRQCPHHEDSHERKGAEPKGGWVFANAFGDGGDSSLLVRDGLTATKIQIMARLYAKNRLTLRPSIGLISATYKNTNNPAWTEKRSLSSPKTTEKKMVLLDTPAISQMQRDPEYSNAICSATCIAMLLCAKGEDVLPEDIVLMNLDYGFGGNGNWSFSAAAAGAYGYESYVHYSSFYELRQQLSKGNGVTLSVKYSNEEGGRFPYLQNSPTSTAGHLINIVGYYFSEDLNEYVYYSNDPAAKNDEQVYAREYRESHLDKAWYRRAAYFVCDKVEGRGAWPRITRQGRLIPVEGKENTYAMVLDSGEHIQLPYNFLFDKRRHFGLRGTIAITLDGNERTLPSGPKRVTANNVFFYERAFPTVEGFIEISSNFFEKAFSQGRGATLYAISANGYKYIMRAEATDDRFIAQDGEQKPKIKVGTIAAAAVTVATVFTWGLKKLKNIKKEK